MTEACTLVVTAIPNPENMAEMKTYLEKATPLLAPLGGSPPRRMKISDIINGDAAALVMTMDFPSKEALLSAFASEAYQALIPGRDRGFNSINIWIAGPM